MKCLAGEETGILDTPLTPFSKISLNEYPQQYRVGTPERSWI